MRLRRQKEVQKENEYYYEFLREALPPGPVRDEAFNVNPQPSPKASSEDRISADGNAIAPATPCAAGALSSHGGGGAIGSGSSSALSNMDLLSPSVSSSSLPPSSMTHMNNGNDSNGGLNGSLISSIAGLANGKHHHNGDLAHLAASKLANLAGSSVSNGSLNNNAHGSHGELDYMEKMHRADEPDMEADKAASKRSSKAAGNTGNAGGPRDASRKGRATSSGNNKEELISKMESDNKKLKVDLQLSRNKENDLRDQIVSYMTSKFTFKTIHDDLCRDAPRLDRLCFCLKFCRCSAAPPCRFVTDFVMILDWHTY